MDILSYILSRQFTKQSLIGMGALKGSPCQVKNVVHQDGINTVTFEWEGTDGTTKTRDMVVYDGTPIYVWESGNTYHYGDLAIYESQFYRCIVENNDATFDSTKWNEIGSPDGNYDIVQSVNLLPARFTAADRKLYYVIDENCFYLWNGTAWVKTISNKIADLDDVNLDDLTEGDVLVWDSVNEKWVNKAKFDEYKTTFTGTEEEWNALTLEEQNVYDTINIINDGDVLNLGVYLEKTTAMPVASEDVENKIYLYTGTTTQDFKKGVAYQCVSDGQTPATYSWVALIDFGTAAIKNSTDRVLPNSTDLVESRAVYSAINTALSSIYTPRGNITCAELTSALLISDNIGSVYETSDSGTTTALFLQGAGHPIAVGSNIGVINAGQDRILFNLMPNAFDLTDYQKKNLTSAVEGQSTVEGALGALSTDKQAKDLTTTVESATTVEGALGALSTNKQAKTLTTSVESQTTVEGALGALSTKKQPKTLTTSVESQTTVEGALGALSTKKASKVSSATNGNFAGLDASGNLTDSGKKADDFATAEELADEAKTRAKLGAHNFVALNRSTYKPQYAANLSSITDQTEDSVTVTSIAADYAGLRLYNKIAPGEYIVSYDFESDDTSYVPAVSLYYSNSEMIPNGGNILKNTQRKITVLDSYDYVEIRLFITRASDAVIRTGTFKNLMFRLATDTDATYQPYAKTNQQLTKDVQPIPTMLNDLGAKNLVPVTYDSIKAALATSSIVLNDNNQAVKNGITLTVVLDSKGNVAKCNVNGTASADTYFRLWVTSAFNSFGSDPLNSILYPTKGNYTISSGTDSEDVAFVYQPNISDEYSGCYIRIDNGKTVNVDVYPMLRYASIADGTYVPYAKTNQQLTQDSVSWDDLSEVGAVNYLPNTATSQTIYGVAYTVNSDGSITVDGTATGGNASLVVNMTTYLKKGTYKLTGAPEGYKNTTRLSITRGAPSNVFDNGNGATFTLTEDATNALYVQAIVWEGKTVDNLTFYPMITPVSYNGDYVPYAKSNKELTEDVSSLYNKMQTLEGDISDIETAIANNVLYFTSQACSALTGDFCTVSNAKITANHVIAEAVFANPAAITSDVTWTTANGSVKLNGTCASATTVNLVLVKKTN